MNYDKSKSGDIKMELEKNLASVKQRIERAAIVSHRRAAAITLVAVTKTVDTSVILEAQCLGVNDFGENRVQELDRKMVYLPEARWHMIGRLQTNKVKDIVGKVCLIHSLDRWNLAEEIDKRAKMLGIKAAALLQVNIAGEEQKAGIDVAEVESFLDAIGQLSNLKIHGLMTIAPAVGDPEETRPVFQELFQIRHNLSNKKFNNVDLHFLSMGMSQDYEVAIEEGANIIRVGSALFS